MVSNAVYSTAHAKELRLLTADLSVRNGSPALRPG